MPHVQESEIYTSRCQGVGICIGSCPVTTCRLVCNWIRISFGEHGNKVGTSRVISIDITIKTRQFDRGLFFTPQGLFCPEYWGLKSDHLSCSVVLTNMTKSFLRSLGNRLPKVPLLKPDMLQYSGEGK